MIRKTILSMAMVTAASFLAASSASAQNWVVNTSSIQTAPTYDQTEMANHKLYVENLKAAGFKPNDTSYWGQVNVSALTQPNHSKVPLGAKYRGNQLDRSSSY